MVVQNTKTRVIFQNLISFSLLFSQSANLVSHYNQMRRRRRDEERRKLERRAAERRIEGFVDERRRSSGDVDVKKRGDESHRSQEREISMNNKIN